MREFMQVFIILLFFAAIIVAISYAWNIAKRRTATRIRNYVLEKGGRNVTVTFASEGEQDTWTFQVSYLDAQDVQHHTKCKVRSALRDDSHSLYWEGELHLLTDKNINKEETVDEQTAVLPAPPSSSKEQIISDLTAENEHLRDELEKLRRTDPT